MYGPLRCAVAAKVLRAMPGKGQLAAALALFGCFAHLVGEQHAGEVQGVCGAFVKVLRLVQVFQCYLVCQVF